MPNDPRIPTKEFLESIGLQHKERYLPSTMDESHTILEKLNRMGYDVNENTKITSEVIKRWNEFSTWLDKEFPDDVNKQITDRVSKELTNEKIVNLTKPTINTLVDGKLGEVNGKLTNVTAQLEDKAKQLIVDVNVNEAHATNTDYPITLKNYLNGTHENVHPSLLYFDNPYLGYKYWLAYTAFDGALSENENPCIAVSNDGINWVVPEGLVNPITPSPPGSSYLADTHLYMDKENKMFYLAYKVDLGSEIKLVVKTSSDGVHWSEEKVILPHIPGEENVCPIIRWDGQQYVMWTVNTQVPGFELVRRTTPTPDGIFTNKVKCSFPLPSGRKPWHFDILLIGNEYHMVMQDCEPSGFGGAGLIYFAKSYDGITWDVSKEPILKGNYGMWDIYYYKPTFLPVYKDGKFAYKMLYGSAGPTWLFGWTDITFDRSSKTQNNQNKIVSGIYNLGSVKVVDTFNRADDITIGVATTGQQWVTSQTADATLQIKNKKAVAPIPGNHANVLDSKISDNFELSVKVKGNDAHWLIFRFSNGNNFLRFGKDGVTHGLSLQKIVNGVLIPLRENLGILRPDDKMSVTVQGSTITCRVNGVLKCQHTENFNQYAAHHGIQTNEIESGFSEFYLENLV